MVVVVAAVANRFHVLEHFKIVFSDLIVFSFSELQSSFFFFRIFKTVDS